MTTAKTAAGTAVEKTSGQPGPKPDFQVVENSLKCQTLDGEVSISLLLPYSKIKQVMSMEDEVDDKEAVDFILEQIMPPEESAKLYELRDGTETLKIAMHYMEALGERMGSSLGKSGSSSES